MKRTVKLPLFVATIIGHRSREKRKNIQITELSNMGEYEINVHISITLVLVNYNLLEYLVEEMSLRVFMAVTNSDLAFWISFL